MSAWEQLGLLASAHLDIFILVAGALVVVSLVLAAAALGMALRLRRRYTGLMMGRDGLDLEGLLGHHGELLQKGLRDCEDMEARLDKAEKQLQLTVAGVGLVRYNAFRETGSDLSFSLALLDRDRNGVVLTSLFGRNESRCYGKPVEQGQSNYHLSEEEKQALEEAGNRINVSVTATHRRRGR